MVLHVDICNKHSPIEMPLNHIHRLYFIFDVFQMEWFYKYIGLSIHKKDLIEANNIFIRYFLEFQFYMIYQPLFCWDLCSPYCVMTTSNFVSVSCDWTAQCHVIHMCDKSNKILPAICSPT